MKTQFNRRGRPASTSVVKQEKAKNGLNEKESDKLDLDMEIEVCNRPTYTSMWQMDVNHPCPRPVIVVKPYNHVNDKSTAENTTHEGRPKYPRSQSARKTHEQTTNVSATCIKSMVFTEEKSSYQPSSDSVHIGTVRISYTPTRGALSVKREQAVLEDKQEQHGSNESLGQPSRPLIENVLVGQSQIQECCLTSKHIPDKNLDTSTGILALSDTDSMRPLTSQESSIHDDQCILNPREYMYNQRLLETHFQESLQPVIPGVLSPPASPALTSIQLNEVEYWKSFSPISSYEADDESSSSSGSSGQDSASEPVTKDNEGTPFQEQSEQILDTTAESDTQTSRSHGERETQGPWQEPCVSSMSDWEQINAMAPTHSQGVAQTRPDSGVDDTLHTNISDVSRNQRHTGTDDIPAHSSEDDTTTETVDQTGPEKGPHEGPCSEPDPDQTNDEELATAEVSDDDTCPERVSTEDESRLGETAYTTSANESGDVPRKGITAPENTSNPKINSGKCEDVPPPKNQCVQFNHEYVEGNSSTEVAMELSPKECSPGRSKASEQGNDLVDCPDTQTSSRLPEEVLLPAHSSDVDLKTSTFEVSTLLDVADNENSKVAQNSKSRDLGDINTGLEEGELSQDDAEETVLPAKDPISLVAIKDEAKAKKMPFDSHDQCVYPEVMSDTDSGS